MKRLWFALLVLLPLTLAGLILLGRPQPSDPEPLPEEAPTSARRALFERLFTARRLLVVYGAPDATTARAYRERLRRLRLGRRMDVTVQRDTATTLDDLRGRGVLLVGTPAVNGLLARLVKDLPFTFSADGFHFQGKAYTHPEDVATLLYPNPVDPRFPLFTITGNTEEALLRYLPEDLRRYDYQIFRGGRRLRYGHFAGDADHPWMYDAARDHDLEQALRLAQETPHFRFYVYQDFLDEPTLTAVAQEREACYERVSAFLKAAFSPAPLIDYYLYPTLEDKALATDDMAPGHADTLQGAVHVALETGARGDDVAPEALLLVRHYLGRPQTALMETGLGVYFTDAWHGRSYGYWAGRLAAAGFVPSLAELLDEEARAFLSPLVVEPLAGALVATLVEAWGRETFLDRYASWRPSVEELKRVETMWKAYLDGQARQHGEAFAQDRAAFPRPPPFQKGFNYAHEGFAIDGGYGSRRSDSTLARLAALGTNAITLLPYTFMDGPDRPAPFRIAYTAGDENDAAVAHAARTAHRLGLSVLLKPQVWVRGAWPGAVEMTSEDDWDHFFRTYERWITHYAVLAEMYRMEMLSVGVELGRVTLGHEAWWTALAGRLRKLYSGQLVYTANWGEEVEQLGFWKAFDYIGVSLYYPLSDEASPSDRALRAGVAAALHRLEAVRRRYGRPVLLAEVGFPSTPAPWRQPHAENRQAPVDLQAQARSYRAVLTALEGKPWIHGLYWWKWPSDGRGGVEDKGFTPAGKPAEAVVAEWYRTNFKD